MSLAANLVQEEGIGGIINLVDALESQQTYREDPESSKGSDREEQIQKCRRIMEEFRWMNEKGEAVK